MAARYSRSSLSVDQFSTVHVSFSIMFAALGKHQQSTGISSILIDTIPVTLPLNSGPSKLPLSSSSVCYDHSLFSLHLSILTTITSLSVFSSRRRKQTDGWCQQQRYPTSTTATRLTTPACLLLAYTAIQILKSSRLISKLRQQSFLAVSPIMFGHLSIRKKWHSLWPKMTSYSTRMMTLRRAFRK